MARNTRTPAGGAPNTLPEVKWQDTEHHESLGTLDIAGMNRGNPASGEYQDNSPRGFPDISRVPAPLGETPDISWQAPSITGKAGEHFAGWNPSFEPAQKLPEEEAEIAFRKMVQNLSVVQTKRQRRGW